MNTLSNSLGKLPEIDWETLIAIGLGVLRLPPDTFWQLSVPEFFAATSWMTGQFPSSHNAHHNASMTCKELDELIERFPDLQSVQKDNQNNGKNTY